MPIFPLLVAALIAIPLLEVYLLIEIGSRIGALSTVALIVATAVLGAFLLRQQGLSTLARVRGSVDRGELPAIELIEGVILLLTAVLLLTPGFFTDAIGFAALMPPLRRQLAQSLAARMQFHIVGVS
ncbi:MAG: FxsA family protein, partial [Gammaproteobacteria bacterium]|nr:FxsA family protein [Gammaproteobacteria bacterium]